MMGQNSSGFYEELHGNPRTTPGTRRVLPTSVLGSMSVAEPDVRSAIRARCESGSQLRTGRLLYTDVALAKNRAEPEPAPYLKKYSGSRRGGYNLSMLQD